ncbi:MAG: TauD/TfdA family dioxygenase, partial [Alphaproteobacteria bacterium]|nr:TauD/TfdA family dioxygenase [Alphaproteobacteria bacterium]
MTSAKPFNVEPIDATFGAVITGLKLADLAEPAFAALYETWLEYALLVFPAQNLSNEDQITLARRFGDLELELAELSNV